MCKMGQDTFCHRAFHVYSKLLTVGDPLSPFCIRSRKAVVQPQSLGMAHCAEMRILCPSLVLGSHMARRQQRNAGCPERHAWKRQYSRDASAQQEDDMKLVYFCCLFLLFILVVSRDIDRRLVSAECFVGVPARCARRSFLIDLTVSNTLTLAAAFELWLS